MTEPAPPTNAKGRVVLATVARFHMPGFAKALFDLGVDVSLHTGLWADRICPPGLPKERVIGHPGLQVPYMALAKLVPMLEPRLRPLSDQAQIGLDRAMATYFRTHPRAEDPDPERGFVYQALSGCAVTSGPAAQKAGWRYFCERTSSHIVWSYEQSQREAEKWGLKPPLHTKTMIERERAEYDLADRIIVPSRFAQRTFLEMGLPADKIDIVPLIIRPPHTMPDVDPTQLDAVRDWSGPGPFRFLFVGPLGVRKGVGYLAQALRQADLPDWHLTMIGAPSRHTERLMRGSDPKRITKLGAQPHDRVLAEMQRAHCLILPSLDEGYGLVSAEAMSCRLPSVLTTACGVADIHRDGETGLIVPEADSDALARALSQMAWDRQATRQMGLAAFLAQNHAADPRTIGQSWIGRYLC